MQSSERRHPRAPLMANIVKANPRSVRRRRLEVDDLRANGVMLTIRAYDGNACADCVQPANVREFQLIKSQPD